MQQQNVAIRIPPEVLAEQWYGFMHGLIGQMQTAYRDAQSYGINQKIMAERIGAKPAFVSRCLSGQQNMTVRTIHNLARAMDCRLEVQFRPLNTIPASNFLPHQMPYWSQGATGASGGLAGDKPLTAITPTPTPTIVVRSRAHAP